ncbi:metal ABC transporter substrate-binding protein [Actinomadura algeriensis]|uniref:Zinc transport system substrate-binding protein n=1 Tax=Actinomadura algeriensis TaxID=1679523 RepID=A0ABR9JWQ1_9ACTN|nr:metal ABC transporter substrate-binding protein [Actinomadura algeriensis]MBE1535001.1 zinc transport system substrate-binding protein [Actinomadura algeriensis]
MLRSRKTLRNLPAAALALTGLAAGLTACGDAGTDAPPGTTEVVASFYPMAWLAEQVGGDDVHVRTLTAPGAEPHDLELTAKQVANVQEAELALYVKGLQPAVDDAVDQHAKESALDAASVVKTLPTPAEEEGHEHGHEGEGEHAHEHAHEEGHEEGHDHGDAGYDPHIWLDPARMATIATALGDRLAKADAENAAEYENRAKTVAKQLTDLDAKFKDGLATCERKEIVTAHAAFGYLTHRYGLTQISIAGVDPSNEPSPARLAELTEHVKEVGATTVFTETLVSPKVAETLAREAGVKTAVLDPVEGVEEGSSDTYLTIMNKNLETLRPALGCS